MTKRTVVLSLVCVSLISLFSARITHADASAAAIDKDRWKDLGHGVLKDAQTKQEWLQEDNGEDIDWNGAGAYCAGKHQGWRLPRLPELKAIYDAQAGGVRCAQATCRVSSLFRLTGSWFWSATQVGKDSTDGDELAWGVLLANGVQTQNVREASYGSRALCVRDPESKAGPARGK